MSQDSPKPEVVPSGADRRSSLRVRSLLPCSVRPIDAADISALEARILDIAVIESDGVLHDVADWRDRTEDLSREMLFVLNEMRALRQQLTEIQRVIERHGQNDMHPQWVELNDGGMFLPREKPETTWKIGDFAEIRVQIPSLHTPEVLAIGEVIRIDDDEESARHGEVFRFTTISHPHRRAISRYALRRERQLARSQRFNFNI
jgi:c-di-GMP-binding flagellar brake protein YcgR